LVLPSFVLASSGDRNPTFQHCLKGCKVTYCDPSQPPVPIWLRGLGWTCEDDCKYSCSHSFTDNIRPGSRYHQFYGKWVFYRLGPIQEPFSVIMSLGNLWVNLRGLQEIKRRVRKENKLRRWLEGMAWVQINTWFWSSVFHCRDTPLTERLDYFSATLTIASSLLYTIIRIFHLQTPLQTSRTILPLIILFTCLILGHFTYLLSFPIGSFPYGYHTHFALSLGLLHHLLWSLFSLSFFLKFPSFTLLSKKISWPRPYLSRDPLERPLPHDALTPVILVGLTLLSMSLELLDFAPFFRMVDAHSLWHAATIPLMMGWWSFLCGDAIELEGSQMQARGINIGSEKMPL
ncbi:hypothetical protein TREMEDRAFT_22163, partial [Tremella mesenterica DSM 1558]|uniref:uncharacterized protein n=1 Tax=Tremella mesenterica (strain ATCC 24925 / CBS 8224 / DSM 1558 / NBRC 9311 / NRRL Y-6157 / RJB 2259-6 / UBC 559-6) TaxID=578456 RepID=UPI0003F4A124